VTAAKQKNGAPKFLIVFRGFFFQGRHFWAFQLLLLMTAAEPKATFNGQLDTHRIISPAVKKS
jgi:hypothetical protein